MIARLACGGLARLMQPPANALALGCLDSAAPIDERCACRETSCVNRSPTQLFAAPVLDASQSAPVLIVDDDEDCREAMALMLELEGFTVRTASNGEDGLREMGRQPAPCAVLLDLHMPVMDGFRFREKQLSSPDLMAVPVILYSGHDDLRSAAERLGIKAYFAKPTEPKTVVALLRRWARLPPS